MTVFNDLPYESLVPCDAATHGDTSPPSWQHPPSTPYPNFEKDNILPSCQSPPPFTLDDMVQPEDVSQSQLPTIEPTPPRVSLYSSVSQFVQRHQSRRKVAFLDDQGPKGKRRFSEQKVLEWQNALGLYTHQDDGSVRYDPIYPRDRSSRRKKRSNRTPDPITRLESPPLHLPSQVLPFSPCPLELPEEPPLQQLSTPPTSPRSPKQPSDAHPDDLRPLSAPPPVLHAIDQLIFDAGRNAIEEQDIKLLALREEAEYRKEAKKKLKAAKKKKLKLLARLKRDAPLGDDSCETSLPTDEQRVTEAWDFNAVAAALPSATPETDERSIPPIRLTSRLLEKHRSSLRH